MQEFDFLVIGSGSGLDVANVAANQGQSVAVVEKGRIGGTCLNRGVSRRRCCSTTRRSVRLSSAPTSSASTPR